MAAQTRLTKISVIGALSWYFERQRSLFLALKVKWKHQFSQLFAEIRDFFGFGGHSAFDIKLSVQLNCGHSFTQSLFTGMGKLVKKKLQMLAMAGYHFEKFWRSKLSEICSDGYWSQQASCSRMFSCRYLVLRRCSIFSSSLSRRS